MELPESTNWHPLKAARLYELKAEEAAGLALNAFTEYGRLKAEFKEREKASAPARSIHAIDTTWGSTGDAKKCVSDLATYSNLAQMYAAMASMKHSRYLSDREYWKTEGATPLHDLG